MLHNSSHKHTLISAGRVSQRTAGSPSRNSVPDISWGGIGEPWVNREGWMSCWKNRQKKWSSLGAWSTVQNALQRTSDAEVILQQLLKLLQNSHILYKQNRGLEKTWERMIKRTLSDHVGIILVQKQNPNSWLSRNRRFAFRRFCKQNHGKAKSDQPVQRAIHHF